ncbi:MAG TPA: endonuclease III [Sphingobacteriaceae bacterium]|nr:endonuclease III [Sphingobacteriaceae bacterium]
MLRKERYREVFNYFAKHHPNPVTELNYENPYQLLIAVILSAQCTDKRINQVTPELFKRFPNADALADVTPDIVFDYIRSVSYPNNKAKHLVGMAKMLIEDFGGKIPETIDELQKLPGVGRKTANVIASIVYDIPAIAVDTHVFRVSKRIGLTTGKTPLAVEKDLVKNLPEEILAVAHHWLILHGRYICVARTPKCGICPIRAYCKYYEKLIKEGKVQMEEVKQD